MLAEKTGGPGFPRPPALRGSAREEILIQSDLVEDQTGVR